MERKLPIGAEVQGGGVHFRVWVPESKTVSVELDPGSASPRSVPLPMESSGYFSGLVDGVGPGILYKYRLDSGSYPDPASRFQPDGPHGPSQVIDSTRYSWNDRAWKGLPHEDFVIYELHLGTFTREGTWNSAAEQLPALRDLGITVLELMPIAEFPGRFGWGYDGVDLFAPTRLYGTPDDARRFIDRAHQLGMMVILDVVYNHLGPDGNYLAAFAKDYFTTKYKCDWGQALNFDGPNSAPVREFFISNARYWIEEFHFDGLRIDATQQIFDETTPHIIADVTSAVRHAAGHRRTFIVGENEPQKTSLLRSTDDGGCGLDALWNDDFHHSAMVAATGSREAYYIDYNGAPQEFISAAKYGYLYQGQLYRWQKKRRGTPAFDLTPSRFVTFLQNHDQIANSLRGERLHQLTAPPRLRALTALTLLGPGIPMLFQGEEFAASAPFLYFADHNPELNQLVSRGRAEFLRQFRNTAAADDECHTLLAEPGDFQTFARCKLDFSEREKNAPVYALHRDLLRLRREDRTIRAPSNIDGAVLGEHSFVLRFFSRQSDDRLLLVNLGPEAYLRQCPEPLLAPLLGKGWRTLWSSENPIYGGSGTPPLETQSNWIIPPRAAFLLAPHENSELPPARLSEKD